MIREFYFFNNIILLFIKIYHNIMYYTYTINKLILNRFIQYDLKKYFLIFSYF